MKPTQGKRILFAMLIYLPTMRTVCCNVCPVELINDEYALHALMQ